MLTAPNYWNMVSNIQRDGAGMELSSLMAALRAEHLFQYGTRAVEYSLIGSDAMNSIQELLDIFNHVVGAGFGSAGIYLESPLGPEGLGGDLSFYLRRERFHRNGKTIPASFFIPGVPEDNPEWQRIFRFMDCWSGVEPFRSKLHQNIFFEFDLNEKNLAAFPPPGVFFSCWGDESCLDLIDASLGVLEIPDRQDSRSIRRRVISEVLDKNHMIQVGVMLSRPGIPIRIVALDLLPGRRMAVLERLGVTEERVLGKELEAFQDGISGLGLDLLPELGPRVGVELDFLPRSGVDLHHRSDRFRRLLQFLTERELCHPGKAEAALNFPSLLEYRDKQGKPAVLIVNDINHIKIDFQKDRMPRAKIYLRCRLDELGVEQSS
jgi:hypothetical protein